jgi:hypothetical protein
MPDLVSTLRRLHGFSRDDWRGRSGQMLITVTRVLLAPRGARERAPTTAREFDRHGAVPFFTMPPAARELASAKL